MALPIVCPAGTEVTSPTTGAPAVRCGVLANSHDGGQVAQRVDPVFDSRTDQDNVRYFCCSDGRGTKVASGYRNCAIWQAEQEAIEAGRRGPDALRDQQAERMNAAPDPRVVDGLDALQSGSLGEQAAIDRAMQAGGVVLGG